MLLVTLPSLLVGIPIIGLPFLWTGNLNAAAVLKRTFQSFDLTSLILGLVPVVIWVGVLFALNNDHSTPFQLSWPLTGLTSSPFWFQVVATNIIGGLASIFGMLVLSSATKPSDRMFALTAVTCIGLVIALANYGLLIWQGVGSTVPIAQLYPWTSMLQSVGSLLVLLVLINRMKPGITVPVFLISVWLLKMMGNTHNWLGIIAGLFGGALVISIVTYLQNSGRWVRWSADSQI
jgi:hypothetical protein